MNGSPPCRVAGKFYRAISTIWTDYPPRSLAMRPCSPSEQMMHLRRCFHTDFAVPAGPVSTRLQSDEIVQFEQSSRAQSSSLRRRQPCVALVSGMAATREPIAYSVTSCPTIASDTFRLLPIWGSRPAGRASVRMVMNPAVAKARRPPSGRRPDVDRLHSIVSEVMESPTPKHVVAQSCLSLCRRSLPSR